MNAGGDADHVVEAAVVFGVARKPEPECAFDALGYFLPGAFLSGGDGDPLLELRPLGDETLTELLGLGSHVEAAETLKGLVATRLECPVTGTFPFCGVHCIRVSPWKEGIV